MRPFAGKGRTLREMMNLGYRVREERDLIDWPDPTEEMLETPEFEAVWRCIKTWDINVPGAYGGYCGATGNHVRAILDALAKARSTA